MPRNRTASDSIEASTRHCKVQFNSLLSTPFPPSIHGHSYDPRGLWSGLYKKQHAHKMFVVSLSEALFPADSSFHTDRASGCVGSQSGC